MSENNDLLYEVTDGVGIVTFNRPEARNAFTFEMYARLAEICREVPTDGTVKAIIMHGGGDKAFAAGTDISLFRDFKTREDGLSYEARMGHVLNDIERCPVPTIAAINGACTGGGAAIAAVCDLRIASRDMKFGFPIARTLGNCLSSDNLQRLIWLLGAARAKEIIFTSRLIEADEALSIGLISEIHETRDIVLQRATELAKLIAGHAPLTLRATKEAMRRLRVGGAHVENHDLITLCYMSEDFKEGLQAFLEKRKPSWKGR